MTTTSLTLHHKPPPLKTRNDNPAVYLRSNNYYGSVGRPHHGRRKSAVELLQESKAYYVKSESVLDTKQELKNADHLHVRSPTAGEVAGPHYRQGGPPPSAPPAVGGPAFPYATFTVGTCPPYPHQHLDHNSLQLMHSNYLNSLKREATKVTAKITFIESGGNRGEIIKGEHFSKATQDFFKGDPFLQVENWDGLKGKSMSLGKPKRSTQPPGSLLILGKEKSGPPPPISKSSVTFTNFSQNGSLYSSVDKHPGNTATLPNLISSSVVKPSFGGVRKKDESKQNDLSEGSPPPLPPKSPRTSSTKPQRPQDFPQRFSNPTGGPPEGILPPPPPRRPPTAQHQHHTTNIADINDSSLKMRRLMKAQSKHGMDKSNQVINPESQLPPMTLPSPILPPTPPPDVVMESPMSDSGPIISPPPAFSTPVTPMLDRQNSSVSDRSHNPTHFYSSIVGKTPLSAAVSMSGVSSISSRSRKSVQDDDVSMRYSPRSTRSRSRSRSSSSPMSHQEMDHTTTNSSSMSRNEVIVGKKGKNSLSSEEEDESEEAISADLDGDDDDSSRIDCNKPKRNNSKKSMSSSGVSSRPSPKKTPSTHQAQQVSAGQANKPSLKSSINTKLPKSVTENFLCRTIIPPTAGDGVLADDPKKNNNILAAQTLPIAHQPRPRKVSPIRRPILRSKSDLSHRYIKAGRSATLTPGFTLVQVDLGHSHHPQPYHYTDARPPPVPIHNSISTNEFNPPRVRTYENPYATNTAIYNRPLPLIPQASATIGTYENLLSGRSDLDRFFDRLGLDNKGPFLPNPLPLNKVCKLSGPPGAGSESPVFFSSVSSVDSGARKSGSGDSEDSPVPIGVAPMLNKITGARTVGGGPILGGSPAINNTNHMNNNGPSIVVHHGEPSIVERNARVIKWLFNCRKAMDNR